MIHDVCKGAHGGGAGRKHTKLLEAQSNMVYDMYSPKSSLNDAMSPDLFQTFSTNGNQITNKNNKITDEKSMV